MTISTPASIPTTRPEWQPETWNSGEVSSETVRPEPSRGELPPAMAPATVVYRVFWRLAIIDRWVEIAPFDRPVVPDV
jgi:hypothetical protein